jgi:Phosphotransferase enzyme family
MPIMPEVYGSAELLVAAVADGAGFTREPFDKNADSLSGSPFESVVIAGVTYVLKHLGRDIDWIMRAFGDGLHGTPPRVVVMWQAGLFETLPDVLDHALVGASFDRDSGRAAILMRDIGSTLVPTGTAAIDFAQHRRFLDHMAALHAAFWDFVDSYGLAPPDVAYTGLTPAMSAREAAAQHDDPVPRAIPAGWAQLQQAASRAYEVALALATDPMPLVEALAQTPSTLVHGDWKFGNLGSHPDGRTVLLDWAWSGRSAGCTDLAWYLAVNCDRLPESKEETVAAYRTSLERRGVATTPWWDRQLELALLGAFVQLGWSKTANPAELAWWTTQVVPVGRRLLQ